MIGEGSPKHWRDRELLASIASASLIQTVLYLAPLVLMGALTFQVSRQFRLDWSWDLTTWTDVVSRPHYWWTLQRTIVMAVVCVGLCFALGFPVAHALVTRLRAWDTHVKLAIVFAFLADVVLKTYGWVLVLDKEGVLNWALRATGLVAPSFDNGLIFTPAAAMLGMVANLLPFMIFCLYLSIASLDRDLVLAAYDAGATRFEAFVAITLPLCRPGIFAGSSFVFILAMGSLLEERVLGGGKSPMMGALIRQTFETRVNWPLGAALTFVLVVTTLTLVLLAWLATRPRGRVA